MILKGEKVFLRDFVEADIDDRIRWETVETEWLKWDAPWETDAFDAERYRHLMGERIKNLAFAGFRRSFQICVNDESKRHIGWVNAYNIDDNYNYTDKGSRLAIGIDIPDLASRRKGYATAAWTLYIRYIIDNGLADIYTQTWSGNKRVMGLIEKMGFKECNRKVGIRQVQGNLYDALTFTLDLEKFDKFFEKKNHQL